MTGGGRAVGAATATAALLVATLAAGPLGGASASVGSRLTESVVSGALKPPPKSKTRAGQPVIVDGRDPHGLVVDISDTLARLDVTSPEHDTLAATRDQIVADLNATNQRLVAEGARSLQLSADQIALTGLSERAAARRDKLAARSKVVGASLRKAAVQGFVTGSGERLYPDPNSTLEERLLRNRTNMIATEGIGHAQSSKATLDARLAELNRTVTALERALIKNAADTSRTEADLAKDTIGATDLSAKAVDAENRVRSTRINALVTGTDLPLMALDAYWRAANALAFAKPTCAIPWWALAGVGRTESGHGTSSGGSLAPGGTLTIPVFGIPLDGTNNTRPIPDTDHGALDGDPNVDRAVGIMQFIPGTWQRWATDGSGDHRADPQNIYDAAASAGQYLCSTGPGLNTDEGLLRAFFAYNHSEFYTRLVLDRSHAYRDAIDPNSPTGRPPTTVPATETAPPSNSDASTSTGAADQANGSTTTAPR